MSQAFVKEGDDNELLNNVQPTIYALMAYLKKQNNGRDVYRKQITVDKQQHEVHEMSNGLSYILNDANEWQMIF